MAANYQAIVTIRKSKGDDVRLISSQLGFAFQESASPEGDACIQFNFGELSAEKTWELFNAIPRDAFYFQAVIHTHDVPPEAPV